jgi:hypothetical protein
MLFKHSLISIIGGRRREVKDGEKNGLQLTTYSHP